jgi:integrase
MSASYDVKFWDTRRIGDTSRGRWRVRWAVDGRERAKSFATKELADGFLTGLKEAARDRQPFDPDTGLPVTAKEPEAPPPPSLYQHARAYSDMKWTSLAPTSRRSIAEALASIIMVTFTRAPGRPADALLSRALFGWAFNPATAGGAVPPDIAAALVWAEAASPPVTVLADPAVLRAILNACARTGSGQPAAATTQRRKRSVLHNLAGYAVEQRHLTVNPVAQLKWKAPAVAEAVDRRVVISPAQARGLLAAVCGQGERGQRMEAFYACIYYGGLRPSEAVALTEADCYLPDAGWGRIDLAGSAPRSGRVWTDDGTARQAKSLKHRAGGEIRPVPIPPILVTMLRLHIKEHGASADGRLFRTARGRPLQDSAISAVWQAARAAALTQAQQATPLTRRPYDLRHACVSLCLNAGVPATEVASRAGHSVAVLLKVYAHCIDGQSDIINQHIDAALDDDGAQASDDAQVS